MEAKGYVGRALARLRQEFPAKREQRLMARFEQILAEERPDFRLQPESEELTLTVRFTYDTRSGCYKAEYASGISSLFVCPVDAPMPIKLRGFLQALASRTIGKARSSEAQPALDLSTLDQKLAAYEARHGTITKLRPAGYREPKVEISLEDLGL